MVLRVQKTISDHRKRLLPGLVALSLLAGIIVSIVSLPNAQADYALGCGYGSNSSGTGFGYGSGIGYGYGYGNGNLAYGYGNQVCPLSITPSTLPGGTEGTGYSSGFFSASGGTGTYTWTEIGTLPTGLSFTNGVAQYISGTPSQTGTFPIVIQITDGNGVSFTQGYSLVIASSGGGGGTTTTTATSTTTTTTTPTTTTTVAPTTTTTVVTRHSRKPVFLTISGRPAYIGKTTLFVIHGLRLTGLRVSSTGARVKKLKDTATLLKVDVTPIIGKKPGVYLLRGTNSHGTATIFYSQFYKLHKK